MKQVLYHYEILGDRLIIGKFCSIAAGTTFIMNGANHRMEGSTYPFHLRTILLTQVKTILTMREVQQIPLFI